MHLGVDISGDAIRYQGLVEAQDIQGAKLAVIGLPPRLARESFVWNRPRAVRSSQPEKVLALGEAWLRFIDQEDSFFTWSYDSGTTGQALMVNMVSEGLVQNLPESTSAKTVIAIDNFLPESRQEFLLSSLASAGIANVELLWRPVALALSFIDGFGNDIFGEGDHLLVVDFESRTPEATVLELKEHKGALVPLRRAPRDEDNLGVSYDIYTIRRQIASDIAEGDHIIANQLCAGPFAREFIAFTENQPYGEVWCRNNGQFERVGLEESKAQDSVKRFVNRNFINEVKRIVFEKHDIRHMSAVLWHGWPFRLAHVEQHQDKEFVLSENAVSRGACLYASRPIDGVPTYLDTLPGLYILSDVRELGTYAFFHLVKPSVIEGGHVWRRQEPLTRFAVQQGIDNFTAVLRRSDEGKCRKLVTALPKKPNDNTPVLIRAEMQPAHGHAQVTIEGAEGHEDIFGEVRRVKLDWKSMTEIENPIVYAPEVYPVRGRLFDDNDSEYMNILKAFLSEAKRSLYDKIQYLGHSVPFWKLMEPWGLKPPWHQGRGRPMGWNDEPTRGMFGSLKLPIDENLTQSLSQLINDGVKTQDRVKFLNYMFIYAPDSYKKELRGKFAQDSPDFKEHTGYGKKRPSWNWVIGPGRVFSTRDDFELFLDFMIDHSDNGYPAYPDSSFTQHYWWSFFRCLCYHADTVNVSPEKITDVLEMIHIFVNSTRVDNIVAKYCLCAILFSLRIRSRFPDFFQPGDRFCNVLEDDIRSKMPKVAYPPAMLSTVQDPHGLGLNGFVLRFLLQTASTEDFRALEGLTT
ncbi:MAG: hypothetical protein V1897_17575, partial [Pseudomonadota bacterium]